jgi:hypothetical protein
METILVWNYADGTRKRFGPDGKLKRLCRECNSLAINKGTCFKHCTKEYKDEKKKKPRKRPKCEICGKCAEEDGSKLCVTHGGGKRCQKEECKNGALKGGFCRRHGGGKRCQKKECASSALRGGFCAKHGGGNRCLETNCDKTAQGGISFCCKHAPESWKVKRREYEKQRRKDDINFKLLNNMRCRIGQAVRNKSGRTMELVGCSIDDLRKHLELQFTGGMTFKNYGSWHVDHIKPCSRFNLTNPSEQRECFHYTNLQPLWAEDNQTKSDKYED